jgi:hypothetical protein
MISTPVGSDWTANALQVLELQSSVHCRLEEAFRQELFRLLNQYLSSRDATLGKLFARD